MKLGILAVYLVAEEDAKLLNLHLAQIDKHTSVPYTIYAGAYRLPPKLRDRLALNPHVEICAVTPTSLRNAAEHSFYLEQLAHLAMEQGATHIVTLHTDSFPIRDGWAEDLAQQLSPSRPLAVIGYGPYTACLFFSSDFYSTYQPHFLLSERERTSEQYKDFTEKIRHVNHSGIGFLFKAFCSGLNWQALVETQKGNALGSIYADMIFHLHGAARLASADRSVPSRTARPLNRLRRALRAAVPTRVRQWMWQHFGDALVRLFDRPVILYSKQQLFDNPASYLEYMRTGKKEERGSG